MSFNPMNYDYEWTAIVALLAAAVALYGAWRANKIAEKNLALSAQLEIIKFREKWIWRFREEIAELNALLLEGAFPGDDRKELFKRFNTVLLLMNPNDENFSELADMIAGLTLQMAEEEYSHQSDHRDLVALTQKILKAEWEKIKKEIKEI